MTLRDYINSKRDFEHCEEYEVWDNDVDIRCPVYEDVEMTYKDNEKEHNLYLMENWFLDLDVDTVSQSTVWVKCYDAIEWDWEPIYHKLEEKGYNVSDDCFDDEYIASYVEDIFTCLSQGYYSFAKDFVEIMNLEEKYGKKGEPMELNVTVADIETVMTEMKGDLMLNLVLSNLTDYVDMGINYLKNKDLWMTSPQTSGSLDEEMVRMTDLFFTNDIIYWLDNRDSDVVDYVKDHYSMSDLYDDDDLADYVSDNYSSEDLLDMVDRSDVRDYIRSNWDVEDIVEFKY